MKTSILLFVIPAMFQATDRTTQPPSPVVCQYDAAGNRVSRSTQSSLLNRSVEDLQFLADSLVHQNVQTTQSITTELPKGDANGLTNETGGTGNE